MVEPRLGPRSTWFEAQALIPRRRFYDAGLVQLNFMMARRVQTCLSFLSWPFCVRASFRVVVWERKKNWLLLSERVWYLHPKYLSCSESPRITICHWQNLMEMVHLRIRRGNRKERKQPCNRQKYILYSLDCVSQPYREVPLLLGNKSDSASRV